MKYAMLASVRLAGYSTPATAGAGALDADTPLPAPLELPFESALSTPLFARPFVFVLVAVPFEPPRVSAAPPEGGKHHKDERGRRGANSPATKDRFPQLNTLEERRRRCREKRLVKTT